MTENAGFDIFMMANLFPRNTGLPMTIWVKTSADAGHDVRVLVATSPGDQTDPTDTVVLGVLPEPHVIAGQPDPVVERAVVQWVATNTEALIAHSAGEIDAVQFTQRLKPLPHET